MHIQYLNSPIGLIEIKATDQGVKSVYFIDDTNDKPNENSITKATHLQLEQYFNGDRKEFDLPLAQSGTAFQNQVWQSLTCIPFGQLASYRDIANSINNPKAVRAVGAANGKNPISIIVPCHRVIGSNGTLTGYAGGLEKKRWLLQHEGKRLFDQ